MREFQEAIRAAGLTPPDIIEPGRFHRFPGDSKPDSNRAAWCRLFDDGEGGVFGDFSTGLEQSWQAGRERPLTPAEREARRRQIEESRRQAEAARAAEAENKAALAQRYFNDAKPLQQHPYPIKKGILGAAGTVRVEFAERLKDDDGNPLTALHGLCILIPARRNGAIVALQVIDADGLKRFIGSIGGASFVFGSLKGAICIVICEGWATGASIHDATGLPVVCAFTAGALRELAERIRAAWPDVRIIFAADDDYRTAGNPGIAKATEAARAVGGLLARPEFGTDRPEGAKDFNDMAVRCGLEAVKRAIANASEPAGGETQPGEDGAPAGEHAREVSLIRASDLNPEPISWLWDGWLAAGKMHVFGGAPGTGKTTISMGLAAIVTTGGRWPDGTRSIVGNVVIWSGEDDPADTLVPRLALSGADLSRVYFIDDIREGNERRSFDPARDMEPLRRKLADTGGVRLLIVDPVVSAIAGDSHKNAEVRRGLQPLVDLARSMRCALLGITHFSKGTGGRDPVERLTGSLAFGALARVVLVAAKHQEEGEDGRTVRLFCRAKSNHGPDDGGFEYDLHQAELKTHPGIFASSVLWGEAVEGAARELLATADASGDDGEGGTLADAKRFLADLLADGPMRAGDVFKDADQAGYSKRSIQRAANAIKVERHKDGMRGGWTWRFPPKMPNTPEGAEDARLKTLAPLAPSAASSVVEVEV